MYASLHAESNSAWSFFIPSMYSAFEIFNMLCEF